MVRQLARIKLKSQWNTMRAQVAIMVLAIFGYIYGLVLLGAISVGLVVAMHFDAPLAVTAAIGTGSLYTLGWVVLPVLFASQEGTLDPAKLAPFMAPSRKLAWALVLSTGLGVAGLYMIVFVLAQTTGWTLYGGPLVGVAALIGAALGTFIGFVWSRAAVASLSLIQVGRGGKEKAGLFAFFVMMIVFVPLGAWINVAMENIGLQMIEDAVNVAAWTPFGAPWAIPAALALGEYGKVAALAAISVVTALFGWWVWRAVLPAAMTGRPTRLSNTEVADIEAGRPIGPAKTAVQGDETEATSPLLAGAQRWMRLGVSAPAASVAMRTRLYWLRDPRLGSQLIAVAALILLSVAGGKFMFGADTMPAGVENFTGLGLLAFSAIVLGQSLGTLLQYDSTAFWVEVSAGIKGRDDRLGRLLGSWPVILLFIVGSTLIYGLVMGLSARSMFLTLTLLSLLFVSGQAATSIIGAQWIYPVQPPGTSPLSSRGTGQFWVTMIVGVAQIAFAGLIAVVPLILLGISLFRGTGTWLAWAVVLAWLWTVGVALLGAVISGKILDRTQVELLTKMASWPGHRAPN